MEAKKELIDEISPLRWSAHDPSRSADSDVLRPPQLGHLRGLAELYGVLTVALVDWHEEHVLVVFGEQRAINSTVAGNSAMLRAKFHLLRTLGLDDEIEDIVVTTDAEIHLLHVLHEQPAYYCYVVLQRDATSLALARHMLQTMSQRWLD